MAHLVAHHGLNLLRRTAPQQVIVERDAHGVGKAADIGAHAGGLAAGVDLIDVVGGNAVGVRHLQNRRGDLRIVEPRDLVEDGLYEDGTDGDCRRPTSAKRRNDPRSTRCLQLAHNGEQDDYSDAAQQHVDEQRLAFIAHPRPKALRGQAVLVLADEILVELERKAEHIGEQARTGAQ